MGSPTQRSLKLLRERGYVAEVVEYWNHFARRRVDLFGVIDIVGVKDVIVGVQTTSASNASARIKKMIGNEAVIAWIQVGGEILVHGWRKTSKNRWYCNEWRMYLDDNHLKSERTDK